MPTYISLLNYTDQGIRNIKEAPRRVDAGKKLLTELGGQLKAFYLTLGTYDIVTIAEAPSDEVMTRFLLALCSGGNVRTTTLKAFPEVEFRKLIETLPLTAEGRQRPSGRQPVGQSDPLDRTLKRR